MVRTSITARARVTKKDDRPECKYGASCYRKNPDHFKEFRHPHLDKDKDKDKDDKEDDGDDDEDEEEEQSDKKDVLVPMDTGIDGDGDGDAAQPQQQEDQQICDVVFMMSPDGTQWWRGYTTQEEPEPTEESRYNPRRRTSKASRLHSCYESSGFVGYDGQAQESKFDSKQKAKDHLSSLVSAKEGQGWIKTEDPREVSCDDSQSAYLLAHDNPPNLPHDKYWKISRIGCVIRVEYATRSSRPQERMNQRRVEISEEHRFQKWFRSVAEARVEYERLLNEKINQRYVHSTQPRVQGRGGRVFCFAGESCPLIKDEQHDKFYIHAVDHATLNEFNRIQQSCHNPVIVDAWNKYKSQLIPTIQQYTPDHIKPLADIIAQYCEPDTHTCWIPVTAKCHNVPITRSKIGGRPYLPAGTKWPCCRECKRPMQLWLQLNVSELPPEIAAGVGEPDDMIQLFSCVDEDMDCGSNYDAFADGNLARRVKWKKGGGQPHVAMPSWDIGDDSAQEEKCITRWIPKHDVVDLYSDDWFSNRGDEISEYGETLEAHPIRGDKLGGFPEFIQSAAYPVCSLCHPSILNADGTRNREREREIEEKHPTQRMRYLFQVESEDQCIPYMLGDGGVGHIYFCEKHPEILAWTWACG